ncbi:ABC transporter permease [Phaeobacter sp. 11ANDIMAR09]|uniref:ABC transporter permease n=1 Tax=Phaeobacter sp. 11ANDIMAR09 TaxID=1225647 RepID=UPI0006C8C6A3|nr:ABC transporter permease [Phaeobacter sp. 11ANDIMAR09]KPD12960.1 amino acid ABC transporter permease [Phaeobacter sp. 11ANDIMAR09]
MKQLLSRLSGLVLVLLGVSLITFTLSYFAPGDRATAIAHARYPEEIAFPPELLQAIRDEFLLEAPFTVQYLHWLGDVLRGDFGLSYSSQTPVWEIFTANLGETVTLAFSSLGIGLLVAFCLASLAVRNPGSWLDRGAVLLSSIGAAMPSYWLGLLLILGVAVHLGWAPSYGTGSLAHLVLPALTLAFWVMASQTRLLRSFMLEAGSQAFVETLRLRGIPEREIFFRHVLRHAMVPALTMIGLDLASLLEGAIIVELTFARSGLGSLLAGSVLSRDLPVVMFLVMFFATAYVVINSLVDALQAASDPTRQRERNTS